MSVPINATNAISVIGTIAAIGNNDALLATGTAVLPDAAQAGSAQPAPPGTPSVLATLSDAARQLSLWITDTGPGLVAPSAQLPRSAPLLTEPPASPQQLSRALEQSLTHSGLFYESHVAEWHTGSREIADLRQEPQAALNPAEPDQADSLKSFVRAQLEAFDTRQIHWHTEIWPGQQLDWALRK